MPYPRWAACHHRNCVFFCPLIANSCFLDWVFLFGGTGWAFCMGALFACQACSWAVSVLLPHFPNLGSFGRYPTPTPSWGCTTCFSQMPQGWEPLWNKDCLPCFHSSACAPSQELPPFQWVEMGSGGAGWWNISGCSGLFHSMPACLLLSSPSIYFAISFLPGCSHACQSATLLHLGILGGLHLPACCTGNRVVGAAGLHTEQAWYTILAFD